MSVRTAITLALIGAALGCASEPPTQPASSIAAPVFEALAPLRTEGIVGQRSAISPAIRITDREDGRPLAGVEVMFVPSAGGDVTERRVKTDADGIARAGEWTFGTNTRLSGELGVLVYGTIQMRFLAALKPDVPHHIGSYTARERLGLIGDVDDVWLIVMDRFDNPIPGVELTLNFISASGAVTNSTLVTDQYGGAIVKGWTLDSLPGVNSLSVSTQGVTLAVFQARGVDPASVKWYSLDSARAGNKTYSLQSLGVSGMIGFTSFDGCLCMRAEGYYIRINKAPGYSSQTWSGRYTLSANELSTRTLDFANARFVGDALTLDALDPWDGEFYLTWIYSPVDVSQNYKP
jgi:hypothetical protein